MTALASLAPRLEAWGAAFRKVLTAFRRRGVSGRRAIALLLCVSFGSGIVQGLREIEGTRTFAERTYRKAQDLDGGLMLIEQVAWIDATGTGPWSSMIDGNHVQRAGRGEALLRLPGPSWSAPGAYDSLMRDYPHLSTRNEGEADRPVVTIPLDGRCDRLVMFLGVTAYASEIEISWSGSGNPEWSPVPKGTTSAVRFCGGYSAKGVLSVRKSARSGTPYPGGGESRAAAGASVAGTGLKP